MIWLTITSNYHSKIKLAYHTLDFTVDMVEYHKIVCLDGTTLSYINSNNVEYL